MQPFDRANHLGILYKLCSVGIGGSASSILTQFLYQTDHSTLWWMVVGVNWLTLNQEYAQCCGPVIVSSVHFGAFFHFGK